MVICYIFIESNLIRGIMYMYDIVIFIELYNFVMLILILCLCNEFVLV